MKVIAVNNPAAKEGGALTILTKFIENLYNSKCKNTFYIFVSVAELKRFEKENIKIIVLPRQNFIKRIIWDNFNFRNYLKKNNIQSDIVLSIQNTGLNINNKIPQLLYYHQPLPLSEKRWNVFDKKQRVYWLYKNIYPFFIKQNLSKIDKIIVQTEWVKEAFVKKFNFSRDHIFVDKPSIKMPEIDKVKIIPKDKFRIFYPASPLIYKNHKLIIEAIIFLNSKIPKLEDKVECIFTFSEHENEYLYSLVVENKLDKVIKFIGKIEYKKVLEYYKSSDLLVFPSYIETLGLPLVEAQHFNLRILAINLPYSREVLKKYKKVIYFRNNKDLIFNLENEINVYVNENRVKYV